MPIGPMLVPETEEGSSVLVVVEKDGIDDWIDLMPALLREHLLPKIPKDGKQYVARISWTIGGM
ncbi:hypothetical protein WJ64_31905 [Burkholderia ubonensis]|nr:hypothetical protein WI83_25645 [Burkholderia ubonensis]KVN42240.1 hypothetical protein WJ64_31905 [Burkholderia ubonensis]